MYRIIQACLILAFIPAMTACVTTTGAHKLGPDTYILSADSTDNDHEAESDVLSKAEQFCQSHGKEILVQTMNPGFQSYSAIFQCLDRKDTQLTRPYYGQPPSVMIKKIIR